MDDLDGATTTNEFTRYYLHLLAFEARRPPPDQPPAPLRAPMPADVVEAVDLWADVLRAVGWLHLEFVGAAGAGSHVVARMTPTTRRDHGEEVTFPLEGGVESFRRYVHQEHVNRLARARERFLALDAAASPVYLYALDGTSDRRPEEAGLLMVTPQVRGGILERASHGTPGFTFAARIPACTRLDLPFEGRAFVGGVALRARVEAAGRGARVTATEVLRVGPHPQGATYATARAALAHRGSDGSP